MVTMRIGRAAKAFAEVSTYQKAAWWVRAIMPWHSQCVGWSGLLDGFYCLDDWQSQGKFIAIAAWGPGLKLLLICVRSQPVDKGFGSAIDMALQDIDGMAVLASIAQAGSSITLPVELNDAWKLFKPLNTVQKASCQKADPDYVAYGLVKKMPEMDVSGEICTNSLCTRMRKNQQQNSMVHGSFLFFVNLAPLNLVKLRSCRYRPVFPRRSRFPLGKQPCFPDCHLALLIPDLYSKGRCQLAGSKIILSRDHVVQKRWSCEVVGSHHCWYNISWPMA